MLNTWRWRQAWSPTITGDTIASFHVERSLVVRPQEPGVRGIRDNVMFLSPFDLSDAAVDSLVDAMMYQGVQSIFAWTSVLERIAITLQNAPEKKSALKFQFIENLGEALSRSQRDDIERVLGCRIADHYGCREIYSIARECRGGGRLHVASDNAYVEIFNGDQKLRCGEEGEIVLTSLNQFAMPFIRYRLGDLGKINVDKCSCGNTNPTIEVSGARKSDYLIGPQRRVSVVFLNWQIGQLVRAGYDIVQFRVVQTAIDKFDATFAYRGEHRDQLAETFSRSLREQLGETVVVRCVFVDYLPPLPSGKSPSFVNKHSPT